MCNQQQPVKGQHGAANSGEDARPEEQSTFDQNFSSDESGESDDNYQTPASIEKVLVFFF